MLSLFSSRFFKALTPITSASFFILSASLFTCSLWLSSAFRIEEREKFSAGDLSLLCRLLPLVQSSSLLLYLLLSLLILLLLELLPSLPLLVDLLRSLLRLLDLVLSLEYFRLSLIMFCIQLSSSLSIAFFL